jgi:hypothetical protein
MTIATDLDAWAAGIETASGIRTTRDPDACFPPCLFVDEPEFAAVTMPGNVTGTLPVYVLGAGSGKPRLDEILGMLPAAWKATDTRNAAPATITVGGQDFAAYRLTVPIRITIT